MGTIFTNRKAQLGINDIGNLVFAVLIGAIVLGLGATILDKIGTTQTDKSVLLANNESLTWKGNNSPYSFIQEAVDTGSVVVYFEAFKINKGRNYTFSGNSLTIINETVLFNGSDGSTDTASTIVTSKINITYSYNIGSAALNTTKFGLTGVGTMAGFIPTIAIVAISAVVIGIILVFFGRRFRG